MARIEASYYGLSDESYLEYMRTRAATLDLRDSMAENTDRVIAATVAANIASTAVIHRGLDTLQSGLSAGFNRIDGKLDVMQGDMNAGFTSVAYGMQDGFTALGYNMQDGFTSLAYGMNAGFTSLATGMQGGFTAVSRQIGEMGVAMNMGFVRMESAVLESAKAVCDRLDRISDILKTPSLTQAREYYVRAWDYYQKGFYEEALEEVNKCLGIIKVDYIAWFLLGKIYLLGLGEFGSVIDLDAAIDALTKAAKYVTPDSRAFAEAKLLASEILFFLGQAKQNKAYDLLHGGERDGAQALLTEAARDFSLSYECSDKMLESLYNAARCHAALEKIDESCACLGTIIRKDPSYTIKAALDPDFNAMQEAFKKLIDGLRDEHSPVLRESLTRYRRLIAEATELDIPTGDINESELLRSLNGAADAAKGLPYLDTLELQREISTLIGLLERKIAARKNYLAEIAAEKEAQRKRLEEAQRKYLANFLVVNGVLIKYHGSDREVKIPDSLGITSIGKAVFKDNQLTSAVIPDSVTSIGEYAFYKNQLTSVVIPDRVTSIGKEAFSHNQLTSVVIPDRVTSIGEEAFSYNQLTSVVIPDGVTSIGKGAFRDNQLTSVVIPDSVTSIGESAFVWNQLTSVVIPDSVTSIENWAFGKNRLTSVVIPDSVTSIGEFAFQSNRLTSVVIPDNVTSIGGSAFYGNQLTSVVIPDSVTSIGPEAFGKNQLTSVVIPNSVTSIGDWAFSHNQLTSVVIPDRVTSVGEEVFKDNNLTSITMPANLDLSDSVCDGNFDGYYTSQGKKAGVYTYSEGTWHRQKSEGENKLESRGGSKSGGCFITTAVCRTLGKPDQCEELTRFRRFRDTFMQSSATMQAEVREYYEIAPRICARIDAQGGRIAGEIYAALWQTYLEPSFEAIRAGDERKAYDQYRAMVLDLKKEYLG